MHNKHIDGNNNNCKNNNYYYYQGHILNSTTINHSYLDKYYKRCIDVFRPGDLPQQFIKMFTI